MKLLGVGFSRTGTTSMHAAMGLLGWKSLHHDTVRLNAIMLGRSTRFQVYDDIDAVFDLPSALYFEPLLAAYPNAMAVLTMRETQAWWTSADRHFQRHPPSPWHARLRRLVYGNEIPERVHSMKAYETHNAKACTIIPSHRLLIMDVTAGDGWAKLCKFVDEPVPQVPFPHLNKG